MTREERLDWLCRLRSGLVWFDVPPKERPMFENALSEEIKALSAEPCEDAISRADVIEEIRSYFHDEYYQRTSIQDCRDCFIEDVLTKMPSVTPKQKMGRWIREKKHHKDDFQEFDYWDVWCSECGARKRIGWTNIRHCPMCGAKMAESEDTE